MDELDPYALVAEEMKAGIRHDALIARSWAESGGDRDRAQAIYIRLRAQEFAAAIQAARLKTEHEAKAAGEEAKRRATEAARQTRERERERAKREREHFWDENGLRLLVFLLGIFALVILINALGSEDSTATRDYRSPAEQAAVLPEDADAAIPQPSASVALPSPSVLPITPAFQEAVTRFVQNFLDARELSPDFEVDYYAPQFQLGVLSKGPHPTYNRQQMAVFAAKFKKSGIRRKYILSKPIRLYRLGNEKLWEVDFNVKETMISKTHQIENRRRLIHMILEPLHNLVKPEESTFAITAIEEVQAP